MGYTPRKEVTTPPPTAPMERTVKINIARDLLETLFTRDEEGNRLTIEVGEPDAEGFRDVTITRHPEDNLVVHCRECVHYETACPFDFHPARMLGGFCWLGRRS